MNMKLMSLRLVLIALVLALGSLWSDAHVATAANAYVTGSCSTYGVEDIVPIGADFHIIQKGLTLLYQFLIAKTGEASGSGESEF